MKRQTPAIGYIRVSGKGQTADDRDGLRRQRESIERYARTAGFQIIEWFEDGGVSGTTELENRPGLLDALTRTTTNGVKVMILEHSDRLARDLVVQETIIRQFIEAKVRILTADGFDLTDEDDDSRVFIRQVLGSANQFNKRVLARRMREARNKRRAQGKRAEGPPRFGTTDDEAKAVARIMVLARPKRGKRPTLQQIADTLNAEGFKTRSQLESEQKGAEGKAAKRPPAEWSKMVIARILQREGGTKPARQRRKRP